MHLCTASEHHTFCKQVCLLSVSVHGCLKWIFDQKPANKLCIGNVHQCVFSCVGRKRSHFVISCHISYICITPCGDLAYDCIVHVGHGRPCHTTQIELGCLISLKSLFLAYLNFVSGSPLFTGSSFSDSLVLSSCSKIGRSHFMRKSHVCTKSLAM